MALLNFKARFVPMIESGAKAHTIRADRADGRVPGIGETLYLYTGCRTKAARKIGEAPCTQLQRIAIPDCHSMLIDGEPLDRDEKERLAIADGFGCLAEMMAFWLGRFPFEGNLIHWRPL